MAATKKSKKKEKTPLTGEKGKQKTPGAAASSSGRKRTATKKENTGKSARRKTAQTASPARRTAPAGADQPRAAAITQKRRAVLEKLLLRKRNEVVNGLEAQMGRKLTVEAGQATVAGLYRADVAAHDVDQGIDYSLLEMKYAQYKDIADAFRKLQNNTYGLCEECGAEIDIKRMEVNPLARFCISCKTQKEEIERIRKEETRFKE